MASLLGEKVGMTVGYRVRFESEISKDTVIEVVTEGILTRMIQSSPELEEVGLVIFDEFHERSIHADLALTLCREIQKFLRDDLRLLIMSATLSNELVNQFNSVPILKSQGKQYPVIIEYDTFENEDHIVSKVFKSILRIVSKEEGDILVFLPGSSEILKVKELMDDLKNESIIIFPLYGDLPYLQQQEALRPNIVKRKIILATSIAETSLTIEGIRIVIDSGLSRVSKYNPKTGLTRLETVLLSKDTADQRAGRAGRLGPGKCFRLWTEKKHQFLEPQRKPEILEADLSPLVLELLNWGVDDLKLLPWISQPPSRSLDQAFDLLKILGAVDNFKITEKGKKLNLLPAHPRIGHLLLEGQKAGQLPLAIDIAAILEERDPLPKFSGTDLCLRIEALRNYRKEKGNTKKKEQFAKIEKNVNFWSKLMKVESGTSDFPFNIVGVLLFAAFPERLAVQKEKDLLRYRLGNGKIVKLEEGDALVVEKWIAIAHLDEGSKEGKIFLAAAVNLKDLEQFTYYQKKVEWNKEKGILLCLLEKKIGHLIIQTTFNEDVAQEEKTEVLLSTVKSEGLNLFEWKEGSTCYLNKIISLKIWNPEIEFIPNDISESIITNCEKWILPYLIHIKKREDFLKVNMEEVLKNFFSWDQQKLIEKLAPSSIKVPSGSDVPLKYFSNGSPPVLAVRLQELFGLMSTPRINQGKTSIMMHLLSPGYKPVQVTQDLHSFWTNAYQEVKKNYVQNIPNIPGPKTL